MRIPKMLVIPVKEKKLASYPLAEAVFEDHITLVDSESVSV